MKDMKKKWYEDIEELCEDVVDSYESLESDLPTVSVIAKFDEAREVIAGLCGRGYLPYIVNIDDKEYRDEYLIELTEDGIYVEEFKRESGYFNCESDYIFVLDNCSSKVIPKVSAKHSVYEVSVGEFDDFEFAFEDEDDDEEDCKLSVDSDGDLHGFTVSKDSEDGYSSLSFYSTEKLCACEIQHLLDIFRL